MTIVENIHSLRSGAASTSTRTGNHEDVDEDEGEDSWVPLGGSSDDDSISDLQFNATIKTNTRNNYSSSDFHNNSNNNNNNNNNNNDNRNSFSNTNVPDTSASTGTNSNSNANATLKSLKSRHERNQNLKQNFVDRPLYLFPRIFFSHLMTELWNSNNTIRLGIIFIMTGILLQLSSFIILFSFSLYKLPQMIISTIIVGTLSYFFFFYLDNPIRDFSKKQLNANTNDNSNTNTNTNHHHEDHILLDKFFTCLEYMNGIMMRRIFIGVCFILPIFMEMKALIILSSFVTESTTTNPHSMAPTSFLTRFSICLAVVIIELLLLTLVHFRVTKESSMVSPPPPSSKKWEHGNYPIGPITFKLKRHTTLFDIRVQSWIYLYITALIATTYMVRMNQIHRPIILAAPFLLVTGSFLILSCRQGNGNNNNDNDNDNDNAEDENDLFLKITRRALRLSLIDMLTLVGEDITEDDKLQLNMLQWIIDFWATTANNDEGSSSGRNSTGTSSTATSAPNPTSSRTGSFATMHDGRVPSMDETSYSTGSGLGRDSSTTFNASSNHSRSNQQRTSSPTLNNRMKLPSFINIDERAQPAVLSYKQAVEEFPPSRNTCIILAIAKRCPALLSGTYLYLSGSFNATCATIVLLPMIILETMRISEWMNACHRASIIERLHTSTNNNNNEPYEEATLNRSNNNDESQLLPKNMEPMEVLLSIDSYSPFNRGSALMVWTNVKGTVGALESSLTAAKCIHTANIATDVANDTMPFIKLGLETKEKGLSHGIGVLAKDIFHFHQARSMANDNNDQSSTARNGQSRHQQQSSYSKAAMNIINNVPRISKNVGELLEDGKKVNNIMNPIISGVSGLFEKGWISGKHEVDSDSSSNKREDENSNSNHYSSMDPSELNRSQSNHTPVEEDDHNKVRNDGQAFADMFYDIDDSSTTSRDEQSKSESINDESRNNNAYQEQNEDNPKKEESKTQSIDLEDQSIPIVGGIKDMDSTSPEIDGFKNDSNSNEGNRENVSTFTQNDQFQSNVESQSNTNENNGLGFLGAGLAVVAATVVGGIALVAKSDAEERQRNDSNNASRRSSVTIERLE